MSQTIYLLATICHSHRDIRTLFSSNAILIHHTYFINTVHLFATLFTIQYYFNQCCNTLKIINNFIPLLLNGRTLTATFILSVDILSATCLQHTQKINAFNRLFAQSPHIHPFSNITKHYKHHTEHNTTRRFRHIREKRS